MRRLIQILFGVFLEFGDFGIAELFLLNLEWLLKQRHHLEVLAQAHLFPDVCIGPTSWISYLMQRGQ